MHYYPVTIHMQVQLLFCVLLCSNVLDLLAHNTMVPQLFPYLLITEIIVHHGFTKQLAFKTTGQMSVTIGKKIKETGWGVSAYQQ